MQTATRPKIMYSVYDQISEAWPERAYALRGQVASVGHNQAWGVAERRFGVIDSQHRRVIFNPSGCAGLYNSVEDWRKAKEAKENAEAAQRRREKKTNLLLNLLKSFKEFTPEESEALLGAVYDRGDIQLDPKDTLRRLEDSLEIAGNEYHRKSQWSARNAAYRRADLVKACRLGLGE